MEKMYKPNNLDIDFDLFEGKMKKRAPKKSYHDLDHAETFWDQNFQKSQGGNLSKSRRSRFWRDF